MTPKTHFGQRCKERGIHSVDGDELGRTLRKAIMEGRDDLVEKVFPLNEATTLWRFRVSEGVFYTPVGNEGLWPRTVMTQEQIKRYRDNRKAFKSKKLLKGE